MDSSAHLNSAPNRIYDETGMQETIQRLFAIQLVICCIHDSVLGFVS
jgi:hypothetical protein